MATSLLRQATLRLLLALVLSLAATVAAGVWIVRATTESATSKQLADGSDYLGRRILQLERRWEADAFALKTQIEFARLTERMSEAAPRLTSLFTAIGGVGQFSALVIQDQQGEVLFRLPAQLDVTDLSGGQSPWVLDRSSNTLHRALHQPLWLGDAGMGWLTLLRPLDHALLYETAYPGTELYLVWRNQVIATSQGSSGTAAGQALAARDGVDGRTTTVDWAGTGPTPTVLVQRVDRSPFDLGWALLPGLAGSLALGGVAWLLLSRWLHGMVHRLERVEAAVNRFGVRATVDADSDAALAAETGRDEIARLARGTRAMMYGIVDARAEQARAQVGLAELNASLEMRVEQRTRELAAARDAALDAARTKEQFVANMSHELRTPMNGLLGSLDLLRATDLDAEQRMLLDTAATSGDALLAVINDVLDFAKMNAGKIELVCEPVDVHNLAQDSVTLFSATAKSKGLALAFEADPSLSRRVSLDAVRVRQVLLNLLGNAVKFTARGSITLSVRPHPQRPQHLVFEVADTGSGILPDRLEAIFEPFVQADPSRQREHGGTGLGLAISRRLAEAMGGTIEADSTPGVGSRFRLTIPAPEVDVELLTAAAPGVADDGPIAGRVLLVEDNVVNRIVAGTMLRRMGLEVVECGNGREACDLVIREPFDAVLMDVMMPEMDGLSATRAIRAREAREGLRRLPVIALTASAMAGDVQAAADAGMDAHVAKPFSQQQLSRTLRRCLETATDLR